VIGPDAATELFDKDVSVGSNIYIKDTKFKVIGILQSVGNPEDDRAFYISNDDMRNIFELGNQVDIIMATVVESYDVELAAENTKILLENRLGKDTVNVQTFAQMVEQVNTILGIVQATLGGIALVSLIVGAVGIVNTMFVIITEKTKEIGIMKAIGATNENIFTIYILQAGIFGFLGAVFGTFFGGIGGKLFGWWAANNGFTFLEITIDPIAVTALLIFGFVIGSLSGFIPAYRASKLLIVDTFRK
jgi:putative ABC transport system permease protein